MKYDRRNESYNFILAHTTALPAGSRVLFLGKGHSKNAVLLARFGMHIEVLDSSDKELMRVQNEALEAEVFLVTRQTRIEYWQLPHTYDAIVLGNFPLPSTKHRFLFEKILASLGPKGLIVGETWSEKNHENELADNKDPYRFIALYMLFQDLPCQLLKINKELKENRYLMRFLVQKN